MVEAVVSKIGDFILTDRPHQSSWVHKSRPIWVTHYPSTRLRAAFFQAYRAIQKVPAGRAPWTVDNRRIGSEDGFETLEQAVHAAEAA